MSENRRTPRTAQQVIGTRDPFSFEVAVELDKLTFSHVLKPGQYKIKGFLRDVKDPREYTVMITDIQSRRTEDSPRKELEYLITMQ